ncbi:hypothetical protein, partial [Lysinibacillus agricola]|uniref:hypothetical protein n=1 Tax=Lysinibacillus agricola TaxID=2590012 RepID=UPI003C14DCBD
MGISGSGTKAKTITSCDNAFVTNFLLPRRPQDALLCAKAKRQRQCFICAKAKRQQQMFYLRESEASAAMFYLCESEATATNVLS